LFIRVLRIRGKSLLSEAFPPLWFHQVWRFLVAALLRCASAVSLLSVHSVAGLAGLVKIFFQEKLQSFAVVLQLFAALSGWCFLFG
jgi:hypothetical protein